MQIKDIQPNQGNIEITAEVTQKEVPRTFEKFGKKGKVCSAILKDESGTIKLTLWNEDIDKINPGDTIKLTNGWCSEFKSEKQLSTGKFGKIEILSSGTPVSFVTNDPTILNPQYKNFEKEDDEVEPIDDEEFVD
ncbi:hypothetical protein HYX11_05005 [Candidatus Woesearchaeota archaeon]|nr:hypothetical protein [Candidatus Woesearchaeota archaeon]